LPRPDWILRLSLRLIRDLLLGGAFPFGHCSIPAPAGCQNYPNDSREPQ
jgi:hypothetical protein